MSEEQKGIVPQKGKAEQNYPLKKKEKKKKQRTQKHRRALTCTIVTRTHCSWWWAPGKTFVSFVGSTSATTLGMKGAEYASACVVGSGECRLCARLISPSPKPFHPSSLCIINFNDVREPTSIE